MRFEQTYIYTRLATREGHTPAGFAPGSAIFNNHILRSKLNYQFTRELSLRAILDYNATLSNSALTAFGTSKRLTGDVLLTYLLHPGTALYVGYTDQRDNFEVDYITQAPLRTLRMTPSPTNLAGRTFFVKLSYLFRF
jgi:predicted porin